MIGDEMQARKNDGIEPWGLSWKWIAAIDPDDQHGTLHLPQSRLPVAAGNFLNTRFFAHPPAWGGEGRGFLSRRAHLRTIAVAHWKTRAGDSPVEQSLDGGPPGG
jgi:hypothetical protein